MMLGVQKMAATAEALSASQSHPLPGTSTTNQSNVQFTPTDGTSSNPVNKDTGLDREESDKLNIIHMTLAMIHRVHISIVI